MILHRFTSTKPDGSDSTLVKASNWNDTHTGQADTLSCSVYSVSGNFTCFPGPTGSCLVFVTATGTQVTGANVNVASLYLPPITGSFITPNNLPFSNGTSFCYTFFRKDPNGGTIFIFPNPVDTAKSPPVTINGQPSYVLVNQYQFVQMLTDGQNWYVIDGN